MKADLFLLGAEVLKYFGFFYVIRAFLVSRNLMYASTMHQSLAAKRKLPIITKTCTDCSTIDKYLHLIDMDIFFFKHNYLPQDLIDEWILQTLHVIPAFDSHGRCINFEICNSYLFENYDQLIKQYPKIKYYFTLKTKEKLKPNSKNQVESYYSLSKLLGSKLRKRRSFFRSLNAMGLI